MKEMEEMILKYGEVYEGDILKIDSFLNHQINTSFLRRISEEIRILFPEPVDKILTIEASGIAIAVGAAFLYGDCPVVFAKKGSAANMSDKVYHAPAYSYTRQKDVIVHVDKNYLKKGEKILIVDDFLANGQAINALMKICKEAEVELIGAVVAVEKAYQPGGKKLRKQGLRIEALARVSSMENGISFEERI